MDRRDFVRRLPMISGGVLLGASTLPLAACGGMTYLAPRGGADELIVSASAVPADGALVQRPGMERPVFLRPDGQGRFVALLASCTHRGCQPDPVGDRLVCPCHGSEFDLEGQVLQGPAERALTRYRVRVEGDDLIVLVTGGDR
jgi:cytochrome b6-f complex iron-sulfur subunit